MLASLTGSQDHIEYTVTGVNLASRLQGIANAGETLISEDVFNALASYAECEGQGETRRIERTGRANEVSNLLPMFENAIVNASFPKLVSGDQNDQI